MGKEGQNYGKKQSTRKTVLDPNQYPAWSKVIQECEQHYQVDSKFGLSDGQQNFLKFLWVFLFPKLFCSHGRLILLVRCLSSCHQTFYKRSDSVTLRSLHSQFTDQQMDSQPEGSVVSVPATQARVVVQPPKIEVIQQAHAESFVALGAAGEPDEEPMFLALFKERAKYLFMVWGCTLFTLAYMKGHSVDHGYEKLGIIAVCLVAYSFCTVFILYSFYARAAHNPMAGHRLRRMFFISSYTTAVIALGITFLKQIYLED